MVDEAGAAPWPAWAIRLLVALGITAATALLAKWRSSEEPATKGTKGTASEGSSALFRQFQRQYLVIHFVISLADWLQGTNMYTLYQSYGVNVGALYLTGFSSSALFSVVAGLYGDKQLRDYGRVAYCILEIVVNALEHVPNFYTLLASRVLGGMSTSLLCSVFESRMVSAHRRQRFPEAWLTNTFALASAGSGFAAILAGFLAQLASDWRGDIGPFQLAIALTVLALALIVLTTDEPDGNKSDASKSVQVSCSPWGADGTLCYLYSHLGVSLAGLSQALYEGVIYTVVFIWVPTMQTALGAEPLPSGLVFSSFMICLSLGGFAFPLAVRLCDDVVEKCSAALFAVAAASLLILAFCTSLVPVLSALLVFEFCTGLFYPCAATLRSRYIPDEMQDSVMNIIRVPINILVVVGTWLATTRTASVVFGVCAVWLVAAAIMQIFLARRSTAKATIKQDASKAAIDQDNTKATIKQD